MTNSGWPSSAITGSTPRPGVKGADIRPLIRCAVVLAITFGPYELKSVLHRMQSMIREKGDNKRRMNRLPAQKKIRRSRMS